MRKIVIKGEEFQQIKEGFWINRKKKLGDGHFSSVYLGYDSSKQQGKYIAVKILKDLKKEQEHLFDREAKSLKELSHLKYQNIMGSYGYQINEKTKERCLFLEYCKESNLEQLIKNHKNGLDEEQVLLILQDLMCGMACINAKNMMHRDLSPKNILAKRNDETQKLQGIKIADFGLSRTRDKQGNKKKEYQSINLTSARGTPLYQSPQSWMRKTNYTFNTDVWSAGMVIFNMLTGSLPKIQDQEQLTKFHVEISQGNRKSLPLNRVVHPFWKDLLNEMICFDPKKRSNFNTIQTHLRINKEKIKSQIIKNKNLPDQRKYKNIQKSPLALKIQNYLQFIEKKYAILLQSPSVNDIPQQIPKLVVRYMEFLNLVKYIKIFQSICDCIRKKRFQIPGYPTIKMEQHPSQAILLHYYSYHLYNVILQIQWRLSGIYQQLNEQLYSRGDLKMPKTHLYEQSKQQKYPQQSQYQECFNILLKQYFTDNLLKNGEKSYLGNFSHSFAICSKIQQLFPNSSYAEGSDRIQNTLKLLKQMSYNQVLNYSGH